MAKSSLTAADHDVNVALEWRRHSIMKRFFLTGLPHCPWKIQEHDKTIFVGMPFIDKGELVFNDVYQYGIRPAVSQLGLDVWRADENMSNVVIMCKICQGIQKSRYAIIDISAWNSNVLFEFGLVCGLGKRAVLLKNKMSSVPTDLRGLEYISYKDDFEQLKIKIIDNLGKVVAKSSPQKDRR